MSAQLTYKSPGWNVPTNVTCGAGTIIRDRHGSPSLPYGSSPAGSPGPRETRPYRKSSTPRAHRFTLATAAIGGSQHTTKCQDSSGARESAPRLEFACFQIAYGALRRLDARLRAQPHPSVPFSVWIDGFPEQGRSVSSLCPPVGQLLPALADLTLLIRPRP